MVIKMIVINLLNHTQIKLTRGMISVSGENWFIEINTWLGISYTFDYGEYPPIQWITWRKK
jgi:hypothetical protein